MVLFIDMLCFGIYPDAIKGIGYGKYYSLWMSYLISERLDQYYKNNAYFIFYFPAIVLGSVIGMATANDIQKWIDNKFKKQRPNQQAFNAVNT